MRQTCRPGTPCSVLLIEDDPLIPALLSRGVSTYEPGCFMIETAACLADAVPKLEGIAYDVAAVDLGLPDSPKGPHANGWSDAIATLQVVKRLIGDRMPIVVLTGLYDSETELCAFEIGAVEYITKPFDVQRVLMRFRHAVLRHRHIDSKIARLKEDAEILRSIEPLVSGEPQARLHQAANDVLAVAQTFRSGAL